MTFHYRDLRPYPCHACKVFAPPELCQRKVYGSKSTGNTFALFFLPLGCHLILESICFCTCDLKDLLLVGPGRTSGRLVLQVRSQTHPERLPIHRNALFSPTGNHSRNVCNYSSLSPYFIRSELSRQVYLRCCNGSALDLDHSWSGVAVGEFEDSRTEKYVFETPR
jgi:hypothetical protein